MKTIYHKKNELFEVESFKDKECTEDFDFTGKENLYIQLVNGELTPLVYAIDKALYGTKIYCSYANNEILNPLKIGAGKKHIQIITLDDITPNLSKYIPEDNAVLFLSEEGMEKYKDYFPSNHIGLYINDGKNDETFIANNTESLINGIVDVKKGNATIFLTHGTQSEIQKANEVAKELMEKYGVEEVNIVALHYFIPKKLFIKTLRPSKVDRMYDNEIYGYEMQKICKHINKIITTNSTGILKPEDSNERLQVIDCKKIIEEYLKEII